MAENTDFQHAPLQTSTSIRLLHLQGVSGTGRIDLTISQHEIKHVKEQGYYALSYVWGDPPPRGHEYDHVVYIDGLRCAVRPNLHAFFTYIADRSERWAIKRLWMDALCLHQTNADEMNAQLIRMNVIYAAAAAVIAWLGAESASSGDGLSPLARLARFRRSPYSRFFVPRQGRHGVGVRLVWSPPAKKVDGRSGEIDGWIESVAGNAYWSRVWIAQEVVLAQAVYIYSCDGYMALENLVALTMYHRPGVTTFTDLYRLRSDPERPFWMLLLTLRGLQSTKPIDMVYGLLGLVAERDWRKAPHLWEHKVHNDDGESEEHEAGSEGSSAQDSVPAREEESYKSPERGSEAAEPHGPSGGLRVSRGNPTSTEPQWRRRSHRASATVSTGPTWRTRTSLLRRNAHELGAPDQWEQRERVLKRQAMHRQLDISTHYAQLIQLLDVDVAKSTHDVFWDAVFESRAPWRRIGELLDTMDAWAAEGANAAWSSARLETYMLKHRTNQRHRRLAWVALRTARAVGTLARTTEWRAYGMESAMAALKSQRLEVPSDEQNAGVIGLWVGVKTANLLSSESSTTALPDGEQNALQWEPADRLPLRRGRRGQAILDSEWSAPFLKNGDAAVVAIRTPMGLGGRDVLVLRDEAAGLTTVLYYYQRRERQRLSFRAVASYLFER